VRLTNGFEVIGYIPGEGHQSAGALGRQFRGAASRTCRRAYHILRGVLETQGVKTGSSAATKYAPSGRSKFGV